MPLNEEVLIETVRKYNHLYDPSDKFYHDNLQKENAWQEISDTLKCSAYDCKKKWTCLRDNFRKSLKNRKTKSGHKATNYKPWKYEETMTFLLPFISEREQKSNLSQDLTDGECDENIEENDVDMDHEIDSCDIEKNYNLSPAPSPTPSSSSISKLKKSQQLPMAKVLQNYFEHKQTSKTLSGQKKDHLSKFFDAMEETVRTFQPQLQIEIKSKISGLITEYELKNLQQQTQQTIEQQQISTLQQQQTFQGYNNAIDESQLIQSEASQNYFNL